VRNAELASFQAYDMEGVVQKYHHVGGLEVTVNDGRRVRVEVVHALGDVSRDAQHLVPAQLPSSADTRALAISTSRKIRRGIRKALVRVNIVVERALREKLHDQRERPSADSLQLDQVAMVQQPACHVRVV
jgi:hypothetical protein